MLSQNSIFSILFIIISQLKAHLNVKSWEQNKAISKSFRNNKITNDLDFLVDLNISHR